MHICPCFAKKGSTAILPVFFVWVGFSLCNFSVYRNVLIHWFRFLIYTFFSPSFSESHTYSSLLWQLRELQSKDLMKGCIPPFFYEGLIQTYCLQQSLDQAEGICLHRVSKKSKFPPDKCTPALSTGRWNWQSSPICRAPTQHSLKSIVRLWPSLTNNRQTLCESLSRDANIPDFGRAR